MKRDLHQPGLPSLFSRFQNQAFLTMRVKKKLPNHPSIHPPHPLLLLLQEISLTEDDCLCQELHDSPAALSPPTHPTFSSFSLIGKYFLPHNGMRPSPLIFSSAVFLVFFLPALIILQLPWQAAGRGWGDPPINPHPARDAERLSPRKPWHPLVGEADRWL